MKEQYKPSDSGAFGLCSQVMASRKKNKAWLQDDMKLAVDACRDGTMSIYAAAKRFKVPRMTLSDRVHGKVGTDPQVGHPKSLTDEEEIAITSYISYMYERRFPVDRNQVIRLAWAIDLKREKAKRVFGDNGPSLMWWRGFRDRHEDFSLRKAEVIEKRCILNADQSIINAYFDVLEETLRDHKLFDRPHLIFNCDEAAIILNKSAARVLVPRKSKHAHTIGNANTQHVSVLCCVNAAGTALPPMLVFAKGLPSGRRFQHEGPVNAAYCHTDSGLVNQTIYTQWFEKVFLRYAPSERPLLLLQDGASAHLSPHLIDAAIKNDVILLCFPPKLTHILQPCDVGIYRSMKANLSRIMQQLKMLRGELLVSKSKIPAVFRDAFENTFTPALITSAFRKCGVYPFSRETISQDLIKPSPVVTPINETTSARDTTLDLRSIAAHPMNVDHGVIGGTDSNAESESQSTKGITEGQTSIPETGVRIIADLQLDIVSPSNVPVVAEILFEASSDEVVHSCPPHVALAAIETSLTPKKLARFAQNEVRGVDDTKDPVYSTWRYLREQANGKKESKLKENTTRVEEHPLYKAGLIPRRLVEVFQTPPESASIPRRGRGTTKAGVLTSQEISDSIKQHDLKRKMAAAQKEERKRARTDKKAKQAEETVKRRSSARRAKPTANLAKDLPSERLQYFNQLQDALLTCTTYSAMADMLPSELLYGDLEVNPPSVNDAKKLRTDDVANGLLASSFKAMNLRSVHVAGDGNCFPRTGSVLCCGNEERHVEIRMKVVHELIVHSDLYLSDDFLSAGSGIGHLSLKYAQYSMFHAAGRKLTTSDIRGQYEQEVMEVARRNAYCGIWQLHALTSLLAITLSRPWTAES